MKGRKTMIKRYVRMLIFRQYADSDSYILWLKKLGVRIGKRSTIFDPRTVCIDVTRPWLITIGNDVQITRGVTILTHGYDWSVLKATYGEVLGSSGGVNIGDNVFVGMYTTILKGVRIGNNVIVGANSLVNKNVPDNCVVAGNPAEVIMSLEQYYQKRKLEQIDEATELVIEYRKAYNKDPTEEELSEFFWLFTAGIDELPECWKKKMRLVGNEEQSYQKLNMHKKEFADMNDFLKAIKREN